MEDFAQLERAVSSLAAGQTTDSDQQTLKHCLDWVRPDLMNPTKHPQLEPVIKNKMSRAFLFSIDKALNMQAATVFSIFISRKMLDRCLELNGKSEASIQIANIARGVQDCVMVFAQRTNQCVLNMCKIAQCNATAHELIRVDADPLAVSRFMREAAATLDTETAAMEQVMTEALTKINDAIEWVYQNLETESAISDRKELLQEKMEIFETKRDEYAVVANEWWTRRGELVGEKSALEDELRYFEGRIVNQERYIQQNDSAITHLYRLATQIDAQTNSAYDSQRSEVAVINQGMRQMMDSIRSFAHSSTRDLDRRANAISNRMRANDENIIQLSQLEANADPGGVTSVTTTSSSSTKVLWWKVKSSSSSTTQTIVRPNQQIQYTKLIAMKNQEGNRLISQLEDTQRERVRALGVVQDKMKAVTANGEIGKSAIFSRYERLRQEMAQHKRVVMAQIEQLEAKRNRMIEEHKALTGEQTRLKGEIARNAVQLEQLVHDRQGVDRQKEIMDRAYEGWTRESDRLEEFLVSIAARFGQTTKTFVDFVRALQNLQKHARNLPIQFQLMATAFKSVEISMESKSFLEQIEHVPAARRGECLQALTENFQDVAEIAQDYMMKPIMILMSSELVLPRAGNSQQFVNAPIVEEVE